MNRKLFKNFIFNKTLRWHELITKKYFFRKASERFFKIKKSNNDLFVIFQIIKLN